MLWMKRLKNWMGASIPPTITLATGDTSFYVPDGAGGIILDSSASPTIATMHAAQRDWGKRMLWMYNAGTGTTTFSQGSTSAGDIDSGGLGISFSPYDFIILYLRSDGIWIRATTIAQN